MKNWKLVAFRVSPELAAQFKAFADANEETQSAVFRRMIRAGMKAEAAAAAQGR